MKLSPFHADREYWMQVELADGDESPTDEEMRQARRERAAEIRRTCIKAMTSLSELAGLLRDGMDVKSNSAADHVGLRRDRIRDIVSSYLATVEL